MQPQPVHRVLPDTILKKPVQRECQLVDIPLPVARVGARDLGIDRHAKALPRKALAPCRNNGRVVAQRQAGRSHRCHRHAAEEGNGDPIIHLLVDQHRKEAALLEGLDDRPRALSPLCSHCRQAKAPLSCNPRIHERIVGWAVNKRSLQPEVPHAGRHQFPVSAMPRHEQTTMPLLDGMARVLPPSKVDARIRTNGRELAEEGIFGKGTTEIVPHRTDMRFAHLGAHLGHGRCHVSSCTPRHRYARTQRARNPSAQVRRTSETQQAEQTHDADKQPVLEAVNRHHEDRRATLVAVFQSPAGAGRLNVFRHVVMNWSRSVSELSSRRTATRSTSISARAEAGRRIQSFSVVMRVAA